MTVGYTPPCIHEEIKLSVFNHIHNPTKFLYLMLYLFICKDDIICAFLELIITQLNLLYYGWGVETFSFGI